MSSPSNTAPSAQSRLHSRRLRTVLSAAVSDSAPQSATQAPDDNDADDHWYNSDGSMPSLQTVSDTSDEYIPDVDDFSDDEDETEDEGEGEAQLNDDTSPSQNRPRPLPPHNPDSPHVPQFLRPRLRRRMSDPLYPGPTPEHDVAGPNENPRPRLPDPGVHLFRTLVGMNRTARPVRIQPNRFSVHR